MFFLPYFHLIYLKPAKKKKKNTKKNQSEVIYNIDIATDCNNTQIQIHVTEIRR